MSATPFRIGWLRCAVVDDAAGTFLAVVTVVADPGVTEYLLAESAGPLGAAKIIVCVRTRRISLVEKGVGGRAQTQNRFARFDEIYNELHIVVRKFAKTRGDDHHVGGGQSIEARYVGLDCPGR